MSDYLNDRFLRAVAAFVRELVADFKFHGLYGYRVYAFDEVLQLADLTPQIGTIGLPILTQIPLRLPGINLRLTPGTSVLVGFENGDPTLPYLAFYDQKAGGGFVPEFTGLGGAEFTDVFPVGAGVARIGDTAGPYTIITGSTKVYSR